MATGEKISVALASGMADFARRAVDAGKYASTNEAIQEAVSECQERIGSLSYTVDDLRKLIKEGLESGESTRPSITEVKAEARRRLEASLLRRG